MRFALIGSHPDGSQIARALTAKGNRLLAVFETAVPEFAPDARTFADLEELLADPTIDLIIVAGHLNVRAEQLRRALQSERDVLCVHPCDSKPDRAYEAALIQSEVRRVLLPVLPSALHPAYSRLGQLVREGHFGPDGPRLIRWEGPRPPIESASLFDGWTALRHLAGEIAEVSGFAAGPEVKPGEPLLFNGRFECGGVFQVTLLSAMEPGSRHLKLTDAAAEAELDGPDECGAARLRWRRGDGGWQEQTWATWDRWSALADAVELALEKPGESPPLIWQDEIRALELEDALRRSVEKRRSSDLEYQEISADVGSKGTLTLIGCGIIWLILLIFTASIWVPWVRWAVVPLLLGFLALLALKWLAGPKGKP